MTLLLNHTAPKFSELEKQMVKHIPPGGNWKNIPESVPSQRLAQIRRNGGGRTTYYGRLRWDKPSYTISTYFNRIGNGCFVHPEQDRLISIREGARLQSFVDSYEFAGSKGSIYKQIGNAVPPLLAYAIATALKKHTGKSDMIDLFCGAGGLSEGFRMTGFNPVSCIEIDKNFHESYMQNLKPKKPTSFICGDICDAINKKKIAESASTHSVDVITGGPPCQGFSLAGWFDKEDRRNLLFKEFVATVALVSPKIFIMENVVGMLSMDKGKFVEKIISEFEEIGYHISPIWKLNAADFGVPQKRKRVFLVGSSAKSEISPPEKILDEENYVTVREAIYGLPVLDAGSSYDESNQVINANSDYQRYLQEEISASDFLKLRKKGAITQKTIA
mgnify:CR=1 FL=1